VGKIWKSAKGGNKMENHGTGKKTNRKLFFIFLSDETGRRFIWLEDVGIIWVME
jgi:hypothetical protein